MNSINKRSTKNIVALHLTWTSYVLMLLMMIVTSLPAAIPEGSSVTLILLIKLIPLLIILPGLAKDALRSHIWLCFIILFYFTQSVVETFLSSAAYTDIFITSLSVIIFLASMFYIKWERTLGRQL
ncbi:MAG: putative membrane protein [Oleiphilaceae bacterium]|jgi:uncharacterized membrane protein